MPSQWVPIGGSTTFRGNFNGQNYKISNMTVAFSRNGMGLFGASGYSLGSTNEPARFINIKLENVLVDGDADPKNSYDNIGALVGEAKLTDIVNCHGALRQGHGL